METLIMKDNVYKKVLARRAKLASEIKDWFLGKGVKYQIQEEEHEITNDKFVFITAVSCCDEYCILFLSDDTYIEVPYHFNNGTLYSIKNWGSSHFLYFDSTLLQVFSMLSNAPLGADNDLRAPWNDLGHNGFIKVDVNYNQMLCKLDTILTDLYKETNGEVDEDGGYSCDYDFDYSDLLGEFSDQHYTPLALIEKLKNICTTYLEKREMPSIKELKLLIKECEGWEETDSEIVEA